MKLRFGAQIPNCFKNISGNNPNCSCFGDIKSESANRIIHEFSITSTECDVGVKNVDKENN